MANVKIVATGSVYTGSSDGDSIQFLSAALPGSTILGEGGSDTIALTELLAVTTAGFLAKGGEGADSIHVVSGSYKASAAPSIFGNAGNDTINLLGGQAQILKTQDGNDVVLIGGATTTAHVIALGKGADNVTISGTTTIATSFGAGRGHDKVSGAGTLSIGSAATINLGEGRDTLNLVIDSGIALTIQGDAGNGTNFGSDSIDVTFTKGTFTGLAVKGGGGDDTITLSAGAAFESANIAGMAGNDVITVSGAISSRSTIAGGSGADTITLSDSDIATAALVRGGEGNDSIAIAATNNSGLTIIGGAGADSISVATIADADVLGEFFFSSLSDSNLAATDEFSMSDGGANQISGNFDFNNSANLTNVSVASAQVLFGSTQNYAAMAAGATNGLVTFVGTVATDAVSSVTAAMINVDKLTLPGGVGEAATFFANGKEYLFMQGGTSGTSDDALVELGQSATLAIAGSAVAVTLSASA
jgi:hypothetical protein